VKVVEVFPAGMVTVLGTDAEPVLLVKASVIPPVGATPLIETVPVGDLPPTTEAGLSVKPVIVGGLIVRVAFLDVPFSVAVRAATVTAGTVVVLTVKVAFELPAAILTVAESVAALLLLARLIVNPPVGAGPERLTVPVEEARPATVVGFKVREVRPGGVTVSVVV